MVRDRECPSVVKTRLVKGEEGVGSNMRYRYCRSVRLMVTLPKRTHFEGLGQDETFHPVFKLCLG